MTFPIGYQTVGIVKRVPTLVLGEPVLTELGEPEITDQVIWKGPQASPQTPGCMFEVQIMSSAAVEQQTVETTVTHGTAWAYLPIDADTSAIDSTMALRYPYPDGRDYEVSADAHVEVGAFGIPSYVFCVCELIKG